MSKLLYIEASPRKKRSSSIAIAQLFISEYRKIYPKDEVISIDLWKKELPAFDGDVIEAKYAIMHGMPHTDMQSKAWKQVEEIITEFKNADKYVFSLPMWNFSIPYKLKHYIDVLVQPGYTFSVTPEGYQGLITNKKALLIYARGGEYGAETEAYKLDMQKTYMENILHFIGLKSLESISIEPTLGDEKKKEETLTQAKNKIQKISSTF